MEEQIGHRDETGPRNCICKSAHGLMALLGQWSWSFTPDWLRPSFSLFLFLVIKVLRMCPNPSQRPINLSFDRLLLLFTRTQPTERRRHSKTLNLTLVTFLPFSPGSSSTSCWSLAQLAGQVLPLVESQLRVRHSSRPVLSRVTHWGSEGLSGFAL